MKPQDMKETYGVTTPERKAYRSPKLTEHGDVRDLTLGHSGTGIDCQGGCLFGNEPDTPPWCN
jgi:hypothetical protein